jgi:cellulose synthase (UDP-forming)
VLLLGYFQTAWPLKRTPMPLPASRDLWPTVDVFIPTYNEPLSVVKPTIYAALALDYPADKIAIHVLDDGRRPEFRAFCEEVGVNWTIRTHNRHAKAGNINEALKITQGEYLAIFDCDHIPTRSFLQIGLGWFLRDKLLSMLQTPHHFFSADPFERNLGTFRKVPNCFTVWCRTATICGTPPSSAARARCCAGRWLKRSAASPSKRSPRTRTPH